MEQGLLAYDKYNGEFCIFQLFLDNSRSCLHLKTSSMFHVKQSFDYLSDFVGREKTIAHLLHRKVANLDFIHYTNILFFIPTYCWLIFYLVPLRAVEREHLHISIHFFFFF